MAERNADESAPSGDDAEVVVRLVRLPAQLTTENFPGFQRELAAHLEARGARVVLDLSTVEEIGDKAWLGFLVRGQRQARATGGDLRLATARSRVLGILGRAGLLDVFDVYPSPERAVASFDD